MALLTTVRNFPVTRALIWAVLAIPALVGIFWDEVLLAGPIIALVAAFQHLLGYFPGFVVAYVVFCLLWMVIGFFFFTLWLRIEPWIKKVLRIKEKEQTSSDEQKKTWRTRLVLRAAHVAKILGALVAMVILGPTLGWPAFKLLGYTKREVYILTVIAAWIFGGIWVPIYGLGAWGEGLNRLV